MASAHGVDQSSRGSRARGIPPRTGDGAGGRSGPAGADEPTAASPAAVPRPPRPRRAPDAGNGGARPAGGILPSLPDLPPLRQAPPVGLSARRGPAAPVASAGGLPPRREPARDARGYDPGDPGRTAFAAPGPSGAGGPGPVVDPYPGPGPGRAFVPAPDPGGGDAVPPAAPAPSGDRWAPPEPAPSGDRWAPPEPAGSGGMWAPPAPGTSVDQLAAAGRPSGERPARPRPARRPKPEPTGGLRPVYDIQGPKVRLGVAWFLVAVVAVAIDPLTAALCYGVAAGWAARQIVQAWRSVPWQADVAAGLGALPVVAALAGAVPAGIGLGVAVAIGCGVALFHPEGTRMPQKGGRMAAAAILGLAVIPSIAGAAVVLTRSVDATSAVVLVLLVSAYEAADFIVGSGASNVLEGPLAGATTAVLFGIPLTLVLIPPFDAAGMALLGFLAVCPVVGQVMGASLLPRAGAAAPAVRRLDSLLVLGLVWVAATAAF